MNGSKVVVGFCLLALSFAPAWAAVPEAKLIKKASRFVRSGEVQLNTGKIEQARESFEKALAAVPGFPSAHIGMGNLAMAGGDFEEALQQYRKAEGGFEQFGAALMQARSRRYGDAQKQAASYRDMIQQLEQSPSPPPRAEMMKSQMEAKIRQLQAIEPPNMERAEEPPGEIYFHIGNALFQMGQQLEAVEAWEKCATLQPKFPMVHHNLAIGYWQTGHLEKAKESLERAEKLGYKVSSSIKEDLEKALQAARPQRNS